MPRGAKPGSPPEPGFGLAGWNFVAPQLVILNERLALNTSFSLRPKAETLSEAEGEGPKSAEPSTPISVISCESV
jgi:hypothetical protein